MKLIRDFDGLAIQLSDERLAHILEHPEMSGMEPSIEETLHDPEKVVQSSSDPSVHLHYRFYFRTVIGGKFLCVVVKMGAVDSFVLTAYLTDRIKKGARLWPNHKNT